MVYPRNDLLCYLGIFSRSRRWPQNSIFPLVLGRVRVHNKRVLCALLELISSKMHDLRLSRAVARPLQRVVSPDQHEIAISISRNLDLERFLES